MNQKHVIIFARAPRIGHGKRRLASDVGDPGSSTWRLPPKRSSTITYLHLYRSLFNPTEIKEGTNISCLMIMPHQVPLSLEGATAEGNFVFDENSKILSGSVSASGLTGDATAAHIQRGFAGSNDDIVLTLEASSTVPNVFYIPDNTELSAEQSSKFLRGEYYINVQTDANKDGEVRGQLLPNGVRAFRATLSGDEAIPPVDTEASGMAVITYQISTELIWGTITVTGIDAESANLHLRASGETTGPAIVSFTMDPTMQNVWRRCVKCKRPIAASGIL